ncbi:MAG: DNA-processing protein DprA [Steroidobacteraceae bacterium]
MLLRMEAAKVQALLARAPGLTAEHVRALFALTGAESALDCAALQQVRMPAAARAFLTSPDERELRSDLQWIEASGARLILCTEAAYPPLLAQTVGAPPVLFVLGSLEALHSPQLAMVGSRNPTAAGRKTARDFAAWLARSGLTITSGLAVGVDAASHEGALAVDGVTVAVFGTGLDAVYPAENARLAARIRERGTLVSEFPPRTAPSGRNFPRRNRIISGLSHGTLVVEATCRSGSLVTARLAAEQGREVFAIPGSIHSPLSRGCHKLIRDGATLVESTADVLSELQIPLSGQRVTRPAAALRAAAALDKEYEMLLDALGFEPATIDVLVARTGLPGESLASMLLILELEGCVAALPGGRYDRIPE